MPEWVVAMFMIGLVLVVRDMAKTVFEARRSRREVAVYDNHPQKVRMERYADSFQSLADTFYRMPRKREHLTRDQVEQILDGQREKLCERCPKASWCWEQYYHLTTQQCMEILEAFASGDEQQQDLAKSDWISHCLSGARFLELLYTEYAKVRQNMIWNNKRIENRLAVAEQLNEVARIMNSTAQDIYSLNSVPEELEEKVKKKLRRNGVIVQKMWLQEKPQEHLQIYMTMRAKKGCQMTLHRIAELLSELCDARMVAVRDGAAVLNQELQTVLFMEDTGFQVLHGSARVTKDDESISGDNYGCIYEDGRFILCLSDGMGSGLDANRESETVVELFEQFLRSGFSRETAARMINSALVLQRGDGMFSTVDLCSIDLYSGVCSFLKAGAAATFIRRDTWVESIVSTSLAAGLMQQMDFDTASRKLYDGDYLIMVTDGVLDALEFGREEEVMKELILEISAQEPKEFARELLEHVLRLGGYRAKDDMTVLAARIWRK